MKNYTEKPAIGCAHAQAHIPAHACCVAPGYSRAVLGTRPITIVTLPRLIIVKEKIQNKHFPVGSKKKKKMSARALTTYVTANKYIFQGYNKSNIVVGNHL